MGMFLGKIYVETPKHTVLEKREKYEIREYPACIVAEVSYDSSRFMSGGRDGGFRILAKYIGAFGSPANTKPSTKAGGEGEGEGEGEAHGDGKAEAGASQKIAMTAPVITGSSEAIAMTAPVVTSTTTTSKEGDGGQGTWTTMQFILPAEYNMESVPTPTDERVKVGELPKRTVAAITFSGSATEALTQKKMDELRAALEDDARKGDEGAGYDIVGEHMLARYNDPFTPWFLRTNEVLVPVEKKKKDSTAQS